MAVFGQPWNPGKRRRSSTSTFENLDSFQEAHSPSFVADLPVHRSHRQKTSPVAGPPVNSSIMAYLRSQHPGWDSSEYINDDVPYPHAVFDIPDTVNTRQTGDGRYDILMTVPPSLQAHRPPPSLYPSVVPPRPRLQLLSLPTEVRLIVLSHLLISLTPTSNPAKPKYPNTITRVSGGILVTCRQIYAEGWPLLYHHNVFRFDLIEAYRLWTLPRPWNTKHWSIHNVDLSLEIATHSVVQRFMNHNGVTTLRIMGVNAMEEWRDVFKPWRLTELRTLKLTLRGFELLPTDTRIVTLTGNIVKDDVMDYITRHLDAPCLHNVDIKSTGWDRTVPGKRNNCLALFKIDLLRPYLIQQLQKALDADEAQQTYLLYRDGGIIDRLGRKEKVIWKHMQKEGMLDERRAKLGMLLQLEMGFARRSRFLKTDL